jgi:hypothetical protein
MKGILQKPPLATTQLDSGGCTYLDASSAEVPQCSEHGRHIDVVAMALFNTTFFRVFDVVSIARLRIGD